MCHYFSSSGGGYVIPQEGTIVNGACVITSTLTSDQVYLDFYNGDPYRLDIFYTEREPCSSEFFLQVQGATMLSLDSENPPPDYTARVTEGYHLDGIVETITVADAFSVGPMYNVSIIDGRWIRF